MLSSLSGIDMIACCTANRVQNDSIKFIPGKIKQIHIALHCSMKLLRD